MFGAICLIWGTTWIAMKAGIATVPPCFFAGTRFTAAGGAMLCYLWWRDGRISFAVGDLARFAGVTLLLVSATYGLLFWGMLYVSSGLSAVLEMSLMPVTTLALGIALGEDRFTRAQACGIALGIAGLGVLYGPKLVVGGGASGAMELAGAAAIILSTFTYSLGSVLTGPLLRRYSAGLVSGVTMFAGGLGLLIGALMLEPGAVAAMSFRWDAAAWAGWAFLLLFGSLLAYTMYMHLIRNWGASRAASYAFVSPVFAVVLGVVVLGETLHPSDAVGMAIMLLGAWLVLRAPTVEQSAAQQSCPIQRSCSASRTPRAI
jgi:drug/metabolite transporter (DMT)-like permease